MSRVLIASTLAPTRVSAPPRIDGLPPNSRITQPSRGIADRAWTFLPDGPAVLTPSLVQRLQQHNALRRVRCEALSTEAS